MSLIIQPFNGQLGQLLIEQMTKNYNTLTIIVAFAKTSGVLRLKKEMENFKKSGGKIHAYIGVDMDGTSVEALRNLFELCDTLHVVHSENPISTFHTKIFAFESETATWLAVGSNNLTGGGLWTNFESCIYNEYPNDPKIITQELSCFRELISKYSDPSYDCSMKIESVSDIVELESNGYISKELKLRMSQAKERKSSVVIHSHSLFGKQPIAGLPPLQANKVKHHTVPQTSGKYQIFSTNDSERIWFETRSMTGGSRNILDLSKLGRVLEGSPKDSRYETSDERFILGGVAFFDIDPEDTLVEKNITINYDGLDYSPCTIKFATNNGSWRIQIKGNNYNGESIQRANGLGWMTRKIVVFEKIRTDYYSLSVLDSSEIKSCKEASYVIAKNGTRDDSKQYGLLK